MSTTVRDELEAAGGVLWDALNELSPAPDLADALERARSHLGAATRIIDHAPRETVGLFTSSRRIIQDSPGFTP